MNPLTLQMIETTRLAVRAHRLLAAGGLTASDSFAPGAPSPRGLPKRQARPSCGLEAERPRASRERFEHQGWPSGNGGRYLEQEVGVWQTARLRGCGVG